MVTTLAVGCPVRAREWILPAWFDYIETAVRNAGIDQLAYVFVGDRRDPSFDVIAERCLGLGRSWFADFIDEDRIVDERTWDKEGRFERMAFLRNQLLAAVRELGPDAFWSVDSDILVHPQALASAIGMLDRFDAVGSRCYMTEKGIGAPSWGFWRPSSGGLLRFDDDPLVPVQCPADVIMAMKLMDPLAYAVDYSGHHQGEDVSISRAWAAAGVKVGWDGTFCSKHVLCTCCEHNPFDLIEAVDSRCGW